jgi:hypothetical protein
MFVTRDLPSHRSAWSEARGEEGPCGVRLEAYHSLQLFQRGREASGEERLRMLSLPIFSGISLFARMFRPLYSVY